MSFRVVLAESRITLKLVLVAVRVVALSLKGAQWLSGRVFDSRPKGRGFEPHLRYGVVVLEQDTFILAWYWINPGRLVPV